MVYLYVKNVVRSFNIALYTMSHTFQTVTLTVDYCRMLEVSLINDVAQDRSPCEVTGTTPGDNLYLNVNAALQLGGRYATPSYPTAVRGARFQGCVRNLVHNGEVRVYRQ